MSRAPANPGVIWMALYSWTISLALGLFLLVVGALFVEDDAKLLMIVGAVFLLVVTPALALWRLLMPRSWKRSLVRRGSRRI